MILSVLGFGSIWRSKRAQHNATAYFNTTGVAVHGHIKHRPKLYGVVRFNSAGGFRGDNVGAMINKVFECDPPIARNGEHRLFCRRVLAVSRRPDAYLLAVTARETGGIDCRVAWHHEGVYVVSFSECGDQQEVLLVMPPHTWIHGNLGTLFLEPLRDRPWRGGLVLSA